MSDDREMLELAARAAGYVVRWYDDTLHCGPTFGIEVEPGNPCGFDPWNPLADDGDAMRLAIDLRIRLEHTGELGDEMEGIWADNTCFYVNCEPWNGDRRKAAREVIVSVAAERARAILDCWDCLGTGRERVWSHGEDWTERCNHCGGTGEGSRP